MTADNETIAVVLLNLGGPEGLDDVAPFLYNLFSDRKIIRLGPAFMQKPLARFISWRRAPKSRKAYEQIGGGSPLSRITAQQCASLEKKLNESAKFQVVMAMRYWRPSARDVLAKLARDGISRVVALTLYPHYSKATTGSSLDDLFGAVSLISAPFSIAAVEDWAEAPRYIKSLAATIVDGLQKYPHGEAQVVYSAHSLPVDFIKEGDPYLVQIKKTIRAVEAITGVSGRLCFQSRSGPVEWLSPSTPEMIGLLASEGCRNILMVPISFVSDHVETLYEIDILYRQTAAAAGIRLERSESLNTRADFIEALEGLVLDKTVEQGWL